MKKISIIISSLLIIAIISSCTANDSIFSIANPTNTIDSVEEVSLATEDVNETFETTTIDDAIIYFRENYNNVGENYNGYILENNGDIYNSNADVFSRWKRCNIHTYGLEVKPSVVVVYTPSYLYAVKKGNAHFTLYKYSLGTIYEKEVDGIYGGFSSTMNCFVYRVDDQVFGVRCEKEEEPLLLAEGVKMIIDPSYSANSDAKCMPLFQMEDGSIKVFLPWVDAQTGSNLISLNEGSSYQKIYL